MANNRRSRQDSQLYINDITLVNFWHTSLAHSTGLPRGFLAILQHFVLYKFNDYSELFIIPTPTNLLVGSSNLSRRAIYFKHLREFLVGALFFCDIDL